MKFSELFGFELIAGAWAFDNTGPAFRYANTLVWHPLFGLSDSDILNYFDKYSHVGYLMTNTENVSAFDLDDIANLEPFQNKNINNHRNNQRNNYGNNHKSNNKYNHYVSAPPLINKSIPYLKSENVEDCCSYYSKYETTERKK